MRWITFGVTTLLALVLAAPASAITGWKDCISGAAASSLQSNGYLCNDPIIGDLDSKLLYIDDCRDVTALYNSDTTGLAQTTTVQILNCVTPTSGCSLDTCVPIENFVLTGAPAATEIYGFDGVWICVDGTTDPLAGDTPRVLIHCNN